MEYKRGAKCGVQLSETSVKDRGVFAGPGGDQALGACTSIETDLQ